MPGKVNTQPKTRMPPVSRSKLCYLLPLILRCENARKHPIYYRFFGNYCCRDRKRGESEPDTGVFLRLACHTRKKRRFGVEKYLLSVVNGSPDRKKGHIALRCPESMQDSRNTRLPPVSRSKYCYLLPLILRSKNALNDLNCYRIFGNYYLCCRKSKESEPRQGLFGRPPGFRSWCLAKSAGVTKIHSGASEIAGAVHFRFFAIFVQITFHQAPGEYWAGGGIMIFFCGYICNADTTHLLPIFISYFPPFSYDVRTGEFCRPGAGPETGSQSPLQAQLANGSLPANRHRSFHNQPRGPGTH